jgi:hypothetical protein
MSSVQSTASRPRQNRTLSTILLAVGAAVLAAGIIVLVIRLTSGSSSPQVSPAPSQSSKPVIPPPPPAAPHIKYTQLPASLRATVKKFVMTAVVRKNVDASWNITTPGMHQGMSKKQWATGNIPPQPFPVYRFGQSSFHVKAKTPNEVAVRIGIMATPKSGLHATTFDIGVHKFGTGKHVHWKVDYWMPFYTPAMPAQQVGPGGA